VKERSESMELYNKKVLQIFKNPKNLGEMKNPDGVGVAGNPICGDVLKLYIKVMNNKIVDAKFQTLGCIAAIASSSIVTEMVKGKNIEEAKKITSTDVEKELGGLPAIKRHCSNLGAEALQKAIEDYEKRKGKRIKEKKGKNKKRKI
jgi:nitrogen fixation NifU-like protein